MALEGPSQTTSRAGGTDFGAFRIATEPHKLVGNVIVVLTLALIDLV